MPLIKRALQNLRESSTTVGETIVDNMLSYFQRRDDHDQIRDAIKQRYGVGIKTTTDPKNKNASTEAYVKEGFDIKVDSGLTEVLAVGFGAKVVAGLASLFTEPGQRYTLIHENEETDLKDAENLLQEHRENGGHSAAMTLSDKRSVQVGSAGPLIGFSGGFLSYQVLSPSDVRAYYSDTIDDEGDIRVPDSTDIEDASVVVIRLSEVDQMTGRYLAIFARSDIYPKGRYVTYEASKESTEVPKPDDKDSKVIDFDILGELCNPLSFWADQHPDEIIPEYPIAIIKGGVTEDGVLMPVSTSLYEDSKGFDVSGSHLLETSGDAARGTTVITRRAEAAMKPLPRTLVGQIALSVGQEVDHIDHGAGESVKALDVHTKLATEVAAGFQVPDYMVSSEDHAIEASSGIALEVKSRPLKKQRDHRIDLNRPEVKRIFAIEKALIGLFVGTDEPGVSLLLECKQTWEPGELRLPENRLETAKRIISLMDKGIMDAIAAIREYYQFPTDAEAEEFYVKMKDRAAEFPSLAAPEKKTIGLLPKKTNAFS